MRLFSWSFLALVLSVPVSAAADKALPDLVQLQALASRFAPVDVRVDVSRLPENERQALVKLIAAAKIMDALFLRQVWAGNEALFLDLARHETPLAKARLHYLRINKGPWSRLDHSAPFIPGVGPKPAAANFYPAGATRDEVDAWMKALPQNQRSEATGFFTTIRRGPAGRLRSIPYSLEYQGELAEAARLLNEAATLTTQPTLKGFLEKRAKAFVTNDYLESDMAWMELDATIEPTIGPYEVYEDEWFNFKAAFEAFITLRDDVETQKLARFGAELQELEDQLPIEERFRGTLGGLAPIRVVNVVYASGDGNRGVQTAAFNLPNDERVVAAKGSKRVMLKNFQQFKFDKALLPISKVALGAADRPLVAFDPFFTHILMHELMHGLGPQTINVGGRATTVRQELKELNGALEEAKADVSGLWALQYLMDKGVLDKAQERAMYLTFLASSFRTLRFGIGEAHGKGMALQVNYLLDQGGFKVNSDGSFSVDFAKVKQGVAGLTREIMTIQAHGDYAKAKDLLARLVAIRPEVQRVIDRLTDVPVDIEPRFVTADEIS